MPIEFEDIKLTWKGRDVTIPADRVLGAIARIEQVITLEELSRFLNVRKTVPPAILSEAFGSLLRYAGVPASDGDVFKGMFGEKQQENVLAAVSVLLALMVPPGARGGEAEKPNPPEAETAEKDSSRRSTKRRSAKVG